MPCGVDDAIEVAEDEVVRLLDDEGWEPGRLALITSGSRHYTQEMQQEQDGQRGYWATYFDGDEVFYGRVLGCNGLARSAAVLGLNEDGTRDRAQECPEAASADQSNLRPYPAVRSGTRTP